MNYLIFQAYGNTDILNECRYAVLSLLKHKPTLDTIHIVIYTDQKEFFSSLPTQSITYVALSQEDITRYKGKHGFVHRLKIKIIQDAMSRFSGKLLYSDSDVYFLKPVDSLFDKIDDSRFVMCNNEGAINIKGNRVFEKFSHFIASHKAYLKTNEVVIPTDVTMWNAGIIGIQSTDKDKVADVLRVCDVLLDRFSSHVIEQLAFSHVLHNHGVIEPATDVVFHYWNLKEFRKVLAEFFAFHDQNSSLETMVADVDAIRPDRLIKPKMEYESLSFILKALRKLKGKSNRWVFPTYHIGKNA